MLRYDKRIGEWAIICDSCGLTVISSTNRVLIEEAAQFYRFLGGHYCQECRQLRWREIYWEPDQDQEPEPKP